MKQYAKAIVALLGGLATWGAATFPEEPLWGVLAVVATAVTVWAVENEDPEKEHLRQALEAQESVRPPDVQEPPPVPF